MIYGDVRYLPDKKSWAIIAQPHVVLRLKRVFAQLGRKSQGCHLFSDSPAFCRDLEWFMTRYPLAITMADSAYLRSRAQEHHEQTLIVEKLLQGRGGQLTGFEMAKPPYDFQKIAAQLALTTGGLVLADQVGLGKTVSAITMMTDPRTLPSLVVTLTHLPLQWQSMIQEFAPNLTTHIVKRAEPYDYSTSGYKIGYKITNKSVNPSSNGNGTGKSRTPDVIIMNYHKLSGWAETLAGLVNSVVYDECQELRTGEEGKSEKYKAAKFLSSRVPFKLGLSATPIYNMGGEMFNIMNVIRPDSLGTHEEFIEEWGIRVGSVDESGRRRIGVRNPKAFGMFLRDNGLMLRRTRKDVGRELPPTLKIPHHIDADTRALDNVSRTCAELARIILRQGPELRKGEKMMASEEFSNKLRQATGIAKAPFVADFVRLLIESGETVLLYGWHHAVYNIWLDRLKDLKPVLFTGRESPSKKEESKARFLAGESPLLILSLRAGAGIDGLQKVCKVCVFGELDWSAGVHEQCIGRLEREGVAESVLAYFLVADHGSDPIVADVLGVKKSQSDGIRDPHLSLVEKLETDPAHVKRLAQSYLENTRRVRVA